MPWNLETFILRLREFVGPSLDGPMTLNEIKLSQNNLSIDITLIDLCAKSLATEATMEVNLQPSPCKPTSQSQSSLDFSLNTSTLSLPIYDGMGGPMISFEHLVSLLHSLGVSVGSLGDET